MTSINIYVTNDRLIMQEENLFALKVAKTFFFDKVYTGASQKISTL